MLNLYQSNRLEILKSLLYEIMQPNLPQNPLASGLVIVNSASVANWLTVSIADEFKIACGLEFTSPNNFLWKIYRKIIKQLPQENPFTSSVITWKIMHLVDDYIDDQHFVALKNYIQNNNQSELRKYQLAQSIAELFVNYITYRPDLLVNWQNNGTKEITTNDNLWQTILWQALIAKDTQTSHNFDVAANILTIDKQLVELPAKLLPENIFLFGISSLPKNILQTLYMLAKTTNVHIFSPNPCKYYWGDAIFTGKKANKIAENTSSHVLLDTMGKLGRDYFNSIHELEATTIDAFSDDYSLNLLGKIQADIYNLNDNSKQAIDYKFSDKDDSFLLHSCHSQLRELQVLHNRLLNWFANDPKLTPKDVLVVMPDINLYTPWINAVFATEESDPNSYIPYHIYSNNNKYINNYADIVLQLLNIANSRCTGEDILEILAVKSVSNKFNISTDEIKTIRIWVKELNIRWGLNAEHKNHFIATTNNFNTWEFGIERLLLGYSMPETCGICQQILPSEYANGHNSELVGKFADFLAVIETIASSCPKQAYITSWLKWLNDSMESIYLLDDYDIENSVSVNMYIQHLSDILAEKKTIKLIDKDVLSAYLTSKLNEQNRQNYIPNGKITFANLTIMSAIPFKIICFLGMNSTDFPNSGTVQDFDLMAAKPRAGDELLKDCDKYAFLQALVVAESKVHISFIGQSINDNSIKLPSIIVEEVLDYCKNAFNIDQSQLIYKHPLQPFSKNNFQTIESNFFSYAGKWLAVNDKVKVDSQKIIKPEMTNNLTLSSLIKFFKDPVKYFYNNYFGISLDEPEEILADSEPFEIDHLQKYNLNQELICLLFNKQDAINFRDLNKASGVLPYNLFGNYLLNDLEKDINGITDKLSDLAVDLTVNSKMLINLSAEFTIEAEVTGLHQNNLVFIYPSKKLKGKHIISAWLSHLCCCYGNATTTHIVTIEEYKLLKPISQEQAIEYLNDLCMIYQQGLNRPLPWLADIGFNWLKKITSNKQELDFNYQTLIEDYINDNMNKRSSYYLNLVYPDVASYCEEFNLLTEKIMQPINGYLTKNV